MATQFLFVVGFVFKQDTQQSQLGTEHNKSCFPLCSKPNSTALSPPPALPSHHSGYCVQTLVLLPSHRNLSQIHPNTRPISTQSVVLFQIPCMAFSPFSSLKKATPNYYHENIYNSQRHSSGTKQPRAAQLNYQQILTHYYSMSDRTKVLLHSKNAQPSPG